MLIHVVLIVITCILRECNTSKTLLMVNLVYRHGARSPIHFYPNDKYQEKDWPDGAGRLTQKGMVLEYNLGKFLKERYISNKKFINRFYLHREVYIRSSDSERCLQSAETQLAGFYPPKGYQVWNTDIPWQPVPVHTVPKNEDSILRPGDIHCPRRDELWNMIKETVIYKKMLIKSKPFLAKISNYTGMKLDFDNFWMVADALTCERTEGLEVSDWANKLQKEIETLENWIFLSNYRGDDELGRILGGPLLGKIIMNMNTLVKNESKDSYKINIFSGHDTSLLSLSAALDINITVPIFASCIIIELYNSSKDGITVEMFYRNDYSGHLEPLQLHKCGFSCPFTTFKKLTSNRVSVDRKKECGINKNDGFSTIVRLEIVSFTFFTLGIIILIAVGVLWLRKRSILLQRYNNMHGSSDNMEKERLI